MAVSATNRMVDIPQRPTARSQRSGQRTSFRDNPFNGNPWGQTGWPDAPGVALDLTTEVFAAYPAPFADLAALKADATTFGDGVLAYNAGANFTAGQFVVLGDASFAHYNTAIWVVDAAPA